MLRILSITKSNQWPRKHMKHRTTVADYFNIQYDTTKPVVIHSHCCCNSRKKEYRFIGDSKKSKNRVVKKRGTKNNKKILLL